MKQCTLVFLVKREAEQVTKVCLALKKRGWGAGNWNGVGGKLLVGETFENCVIRETKEEIGVEVLKLEHVAELSFHYPEREEQDLFVKVYIVDSWKGEISESEEVSPDWFSVDNLPFDKMWQDDPLWLPRVLRGEKLEGRFEFSLDHVMLNSNVQQL